MEFNSCDLTKYEKQMKIKTYFMEKVLEYNHEDLSEEEQNEKN